MVLVEFRFFLATREQGLICFAVPHGPIQQVACMSAYKGLLHEMCAVG